jgi:hypothetical protein
MPPSDDPINRYVVTTLRHAKRDTRDVHPRIGCAHKDQLNTESSRLCARQNVNLAGVWVVVQSIVAMTA